VRRYLTDRGQLGPGVRPVSLGLEAVGDLFFSASAMISALHAISKLQLVALGVCLGFWASLLGPSATRTWRPAAPFGFDIRCGFWGFLFFGRSFLWRFWRGGDFLYLHFFVSPIRGTAASFFFFALRIFIFFFFDIFCFCFFRWPFERKAAGPFGGRFWFFLLLHNFFNEDYFDFLGRIFFVFSLQPFFSFFFFLALAFLSAPFCRQPIEFFGVQAGSPLVQGGAF